MTTLLLAVFSKRNESTVVIDTCGVTDSFLWRHEIERLGTVQVAHIHRKTCRLGWPREVGAQDSSPQSRIFTTSSPGCFSLALEVGRPGKCVLGTRLDYLLPSPWVLSLTPTGLLRDGPNGCLHCTLHQSIAQNQRS